MNIKLLFHLLLSLTIGIFVGYYFKDILSNNPKLSFLSTCYSSTDNINDQSIVNIDSHIQLIDLNQNLNKSFNCTKTKLLFYLFSTTICLHDSGKDVYVSQTIRNQKIWEEHLVINILKILLKNPDFNFIDIGANIGIYTMYSSSIRRKTIAIECYQPNIERIVKAIQIENVSQYVILIGNAIYNQSNEILRLARDDSNIGGQSLFSNQTTIQHSNSTSDQFTVVTTRFDDLFPILVNNQISDVIMKIDIESAEIFLFQTANQIFDSINIILVQMEWSSIKLNQDFAQFIMNFFSKRNYLSVSTANCQILNSTTSNYTSWGTPHDIYWIKYKYIHICPT